MNIFKWFTTLLKPSKLPLSIEEIPIEESVQVIKSEQSNIFKNKLNELANSYDEYKDGEFITIVPPLSEVTPEKQLKYDNYAKWYQVKALNYYKNIDLKDVSLEELQYVRTMCNETFFDGDIAYTIVDGVRYNLARGNAIQPRIHSAEYLNPFAKFKAMTNTCNNNIRNLPHGKPIWFTKKGKETVDKLTKPKVEKTVKPKKSIKKPTKKK